jgi:hypothetical protein
MAGIAAAAVRELEEPAADVADVEEPTDEEATAEEEAAAEEEEEATAEDEEEAAAEDGEAAVPMKLLCAPCSGGAPKCASCLEANWWRRMRATRAHVISKTRDCSRVAAVATGCAASGGRLRRMGVRR